MTGFAKQQAQTALGRKIRVLIVDDSVAIRQLVSRALDDPDIEIVGREGNGRRALDAIPIVKPDLITLDLEMPEMDGFETLRHIRSRHPELRTIMFSSATTRGARITLEALTLGAHDYVAKSSESGSLTEAVHLLRAELLPKVKQFFAPISTFTTGRPRPIEHLTGHSAPAPCNPRVLAIGVSTGGPQALASLLPGIPADFPIPVLIVQHMPPIFTGKLAERLNSLSAVDVAEATPGAVLRPGLTLIAPGDYHLKLRADHGPIRAELDRGAPENSCRPAVDVLFRSVADVFGGAVLAVVLTGMGHDGCEGARVLKSRGATCIVQDQATSVVWGMPGSVVDAGLADSILPLDRIAPEIVRIATRS